MLIGGLPYISISIKTRAMKKLTFVILAAMFLVGNAYSQNELEYSFKEKN
jgi:hypothetical protein